MDRVIFRKWKEGDVIALLIDVKEVNPGMIMTYVHVGQHSEANYYRIVEATVLAKPKEYKDLLAELKSIGYVLKVVKRRGRNER